MKLEDIAEKAGVSRSTVSRVINNEPYVSARTRDKVWKVIQEVGFIPNPGARMLVTQRTQVVGVVIPRNLSVVFEDAYYFPSLLQGIAEAAQVRDYATLLWMGNTNEDEDRFYDRILRNRLMDGLVVASAMANTPLFERLLEQNIPFTTIERPSSHENRISYVTVDNVGAARVAVEHLINLGRRRIGTISGQLDNPDAQERLIGYRQAIQKAGLPHDPALEVEGYFSRRAAYLAVQQLLKAGVDAIFVASDTMAIGAMQALEEAGVRIPADCAIVGFDDLPLATQTQPPLTTIRQPIVQRGFQAMAMLLDMLDEPFESPKQILLPTQLVIRQSTVPDIS